MAEDRIRKRRSVVRNSESERTSYAIEESIEGDDKRQPSLIIPKFPGVNIRSIPSMQGRIIGVVKKDMSNILLEDGEKFGPNGEFYKVRTEWNEIGYVRSDCVKLLG